MKRRARLVWQVFASILAVTLVSVLTTGLIARFALEDQFERYLTGAGLPMGPGRGMSRMVLGGAERAFLEGVDRGIVISALAGVAIAAVAALLLARYLSRPLATLTEGAREFAAGELALRVEVDGPSEVVDLADAFNEMASSLEVAEELRRRMVADVAHELRNPIASLRAQTEGIADGVLLLDEDRAGLLVEDVIHLGRLVDDLQELSLAEAGRLRYDFVEVELDRIADREIERARQFASGGLHVERTGLRVHVLGDESRLAQVIRNLLSNAVRHAGSGTVRVDIGVVTHEPTHGDSGRPGGESQATGEWVRLEVRDSGEGIAPEDLPYIFERFYRADTSRAGDTGGAGIGLAVSRRIVEDHGGRVFATSDPGRLTVVGFEIPLRGTSRV